MSEQSFWENQSLVRKTMKELTVLKDIINEFNDLKIRTEDLEIFWQLGIEEKSDTLHDEIELEYKKLIKHLEHLEFKLMLNGEYDSNNALISIHAGAGGTEAQDWAKMLLRMFMRWAEKNNFETKILDILSGDEAGIKSVVASVAGLNSFGYLKSEKGVHRLVRISPFDANARRHTSFAAVNVMPEIEDNIEIIIAHQDLKIDTFRASGAGGQHINKTDSAVRITHIPTGIVVTCQSERSQLQNKEYAMKVLKAKLFELESQKKKS